MIILTVFALLLALGVLASRHGSDGLKYETSKEEEFARLGFSWEDLKDPPAPSPKPAPRRAVSVRRGLS